MLKRTAGLCKFMLNLSAIFAITQAANAVESSKYAPAGTAEFLFVENKVDDEYFVTTLDAEPRLRGMNKLSKFSQQPSLGHLGYAKWFAENSIVDIWSDQGAVPHPFLGLSCDRAAPNCPTAGMIPAHHLDEIGFYHAKTGVGVQGGAAPIAAISPTFYEKLRTNRLTQMEGMLIYWCYTQVEYDPSTTQCKDLRSWEAKLWYFGISAKKIGHLRLNHPDQISEIWLSSDGTAQVKRNFNNCHEQMVSGVEGVMCKIVDYDYQRTKDVSINVSLQLDPQLFSQYQPAAADLRFSGNGTTWWNWSQEAALSSVFVPERSEVSVFMSKRFFQGLIKNGAALNNESNMFSMRFRNTKLPASEAYQFSSTNAIRILPKQYGISIVSADGQHHPRMLGKIGSDSPPIQFDYRISMSAPKFADLVTLQVLGKSIQIKGHVYCLFESADKNLQIPIPADVIYYHFNGQRVSKKNNCSAEPIDLSSGYWTTAPWSNAQGAYYVLDLSFAFHMNDAISQRTIDDMSWMGVVTADGILQVNALWIGVDR